MTLVERIRSALGGSANTLRSATAGVGWYPLGVLTALNLVDELDRAVVTVFAPNIRRYFDINNATLGGIIGAQVTLLILLGVPIGYLGMRWDRARLLRVAAVVWAAFSAATVMAVKLPLFVVARLGTSIGKAAVEPVGRSLLADLYPPSSWSRVFAVHVAANPSGAMIGPALAGLIGVVVVGDGGWRPAFLLLALPTVAVLVWSRSLIDPGRGRDRAVAEEQDQPLGAHQLPLGQAVSRLMKIPTFYRQLVGVGVLGFALVGGATFSSILYEEQFGVGEGGRGLILAILASAGLIGTLAGGRVGERVFASSPPNAVRLVGGSIAVFAVVWSLAVFLPRVELVVAGQWLGLLAVYFGTASLNTVIAAVSPPRLRPLAFALLGLFVALFGGVLGGVLVGAIADAFSIRIGLASLLPFGVIGGFLLARGASTIDKDIAVVAQELVEEQSEAERRSRGGDDLALRVRGLDFSYGAVQVLFDVDLDVREGEIVALLGTNGAGKSTLLRAVCGLDLPDRGTVRYFGEDVTWWDAESKVGRGLIQVPGGRGTFPSLTVGENLRAGAYLYRRDRKRVEAAVEEVFGYFPVLEQRLTQPAGTLSGGEQQMLALGRAFVAGPRLLMIDELSLGLAPVIVEQLLGIVRAFSAKGTTLVLVEQSVNLALSIATTAYFMERGQVQFGGPAAELLERTDLLRSVFLEGAGASMDAR